MTPSEPQETGRQTIQVFVLLGALLVGAGAFSFVYANWQAMSRVLQIGTLAAGFLIAHALGWFFTRSLQWSKLGQALTFLATLIYGASIFLVGRMYSLSPIWPNGFILWLLGAVLTGFAADSAAVHALAIALAFAALAGYPYPLILNFLSFERLPSASLPLLIIAMLVTLWAAARMRKKIPDEYRDL